MQNIQKKYLISSVGTSYQNTWLLFRACGSKKRRCRLCCSFHLQLIHYLSSLFPVSILTVIMTFCLSILFLISGFFFLVLFMWFVHF